MSGYVAAKRRSTSSVWARLYARVYSIFDDDTGAEQVRLFDGSISQEVRLAAREHIRISLRLPVPWHTPVTRVDREDLRGVSIILMVWPKAGVPTGDAIVFLDAEPLSWQRTLLGGCRRLGLRPGTSYAFGIVQELDLDADDPAVGPLPTSLPSTRPRRSPSANRSTSSAPT